VRLLWRWCSDKTRHEPTLAGVALRSRSRDERRGDMMRDIGASPGSCDMRSTCCKLLKANWMECCDEEGRKR
jgi:hypothetical protein